MVNAPGFDPGISKVQIFLPLVLQFLKPPRGAEWVKLIERCIQKVVCVCHIYEIVNDINDKVYIGKSERSLEKRFYDHCMESRRDRSKDRPLYRAMKKYGVDKFHIKLLEETDYPEEREKYWIEQRGSYINGYNATLGGEGKRLLDYDKVLDEYNKTQNAHEVARNLHISVDSVRSIVTENGQTLKHSNQINRENYHRTVDMCDKNDNSIILQTFYSMKDAARFLLRNNIASGGTIGGVVSHIGHVCSGKRKSAYGYYWRLHSESHIMDEIPDHHI